MIGEGDFAACLEDADATGCPRKSGSVSQQGRLINDDGLPVRRDLPHPQRVTRDVADGVEGQRLGVQASDVSTCKTHEHRSALRWTPHERGVGRKKLAL